MSAVLYHFSEDPSITRFVPHVPKTNPTQQPAVWAIDAEHAPLYWFPRACPRVAAWPRAHTEPSAFRRVFATDAFRLHAIENEWHESMTTTRIYRYAFAGSDFSEWPEASGQWVSDHAVEPIGVTQMGDLLEAHSSAAIDLRIVADLGPLAELAQDDRWDFSLVRLANASPPHDDYR